MKVKTLVAASVIAGLSPWVSAEIVSDVNVQKAEALAWTIEAFASCDSVDTLQRDIRAEATSLSASPDEIVLSLKMLSASDDVCELLNSYAADMVLLSAMDFEAFQARLTVNEDPPSPYFEPMQPEGAGETYTSVILEGTSVPVPLSAGTPPPAPSGSSNPTPPSGEGSNDNPPSPPSSDEGSPVSPPPSGEGDPSSSDYQ